MSELENGRYHHLTLFSENDRYTCSSPITLKPSETSDTLEVDFEDSRQEAEKPFETDFKVSLKDDKRDAQEQFKEELSFKDIKLKNSVELKKISDGTLCEKSLTNELSCLEDGEVVETDETSADLEEGEIKETSKEKAVETYNCRYYQMGSCVYGKDCRFYHVSDKGLYSMFDLSVSAQKKVHHPPQFILRQKDVSIPSAFEVENTSWDQALKEAMDRIESKKKVASDRENLHMTIQSGGCTDEKRLSREFPPKNSVKRTSVYKTHSSFNKRKTAYEISPSRFKSSARDHVNTRCYFIKKSKTPKGMRWSPRSASCSSRSRSRSSSAQLSSNCSSTVSPKKGRRILSSSVTKNYRKEYSSSNSSSTSSTRKTGSRCYKRRRREYSSHFKSSKTSHCRSPVKILLPKRLERERRRLSRKEIPRGVLFPKSQLASKSQSSYTKPRVKGYSDMSISPLSDHKGGCIEDLSAAYCSDRHVIDMSISPLSSPSRNSNRIEVENYGALKSKVEDVGKNIIRKKSPNGPALLLSAQQESNSLKISSNSSSNVSKPRPGTKVKKNSLVIDLGKFQRNFERNDCFERMKNVVKTEIKTSEFDDKPSKHTDMKIQQKTNTIQSKLSRKEMLLKRLQEVNEAIERKKLT